MEGLKNSDMKILNSNVLLVLVLVMIACITMMVALDAYDAAIRTHCATLQKQAAEDHPGFFVSKVDSDECASIGAPIL